jgi:glycosyltransferase involved in cell wall biosynthesis
VLELGESALADDEFERLSSYPIRRNVPVRFLSAGRLLHWKAFDLALLALAEIDVSEWEYWIVGNGPERERLEKSASELGISGSVRFWGEVPRSTVLELLGQCDVLVHPSLHDSGGWVCVEAMAAGRPVICLDLGGPAVQVSPEAGAKIPAHSRKQAVQGIARAMSDLARDPDLRERMGRAGRRRVEQYYRWTSKAEQMFDHYGSLLPVGRLPAGRADAKESIAKGAMS